MSTQAALWLGARPAAGQRVLRGRGVRPGLGASYQGRAEGGRRLPGGAHDAARHGGPLPDDRRRTVRHHGLLPGSRRRGRTCAGPPDRAGGARRPPPGCLAAPGGVHDRDELRGLPARRARRDGAQEPRPGRPRARRDGARPADGGDRDGAQADRLRPRRHGQRDRAAVQGRAAQRRDLHVHPRGGRGDGRRVARRGDARPERVRAPRRRARVHLPDRGGRAASRSTRSRPSNEALAPPTSS